MKVTSRGSSLILNSSALLFSQAKIFKKGYFQENLFTPPYPHTHSLAHLQVTFSQTSQHKHSTEVKVSHAQLQAVETPLDNYHASKILQADQVLHR